MANAKPSAFPSKSREVSDQEEIRVGTQMSAGVCRGQLQNRDTEFAQIRAYVTQVGEAVARNVNRQGIHYTFCIDDNPGFVNAYALPGGYVVIGRGLLSLLESEDELAFILGHEIAHVDDRHAIERVQYKLASRKLGLESVYQLGAPIQMLYEAGYTKEQEQEADRDGINLAYEAGYSAKGALDAMTRFEKIDREMHSARRLANRRIRQRPVPIARRIFPLASAGRRAPPSPRANHRVAFVERERPSSPLRAASHLPSRTSRRARQARQIREKHRPLQRSHRTSIPRISRALDGLALAYWRSGDAAAAETAAIDAASFTPIRKICRILARSGSIANRELL